MKKYLDRAGKATALRSLIDEQLNNDSMKIFADQVLTSISWYKGNNVEAAENALKEMIETIRKGTPLEEAVILTSQKIQQTL